MDFTVLRVCLHFKSIANAFNCINYDHSSKNQCAVLLFRLLTYCKVLVLWLLSFMLLMVAAVSLVALFMPHIFYGLLALKQALTIKLIRQLIESRLRNKTNALTTPCISIHYHSQVTFSATFHHIQFGIPSTKFYTSA